MNRLTALRLLSVLHVFSMSPILAASATVDAPESKHATFLRAHRILQMGVGGGGNMGGGGGGNMGGGGMGMGGGGRSDMATIHNLIDNRRDIRRIVNVTDDGIHSTTWSENEEVSAWIKQHVAEMLALLESSGRIRQWDDLFVKVFDMRDSHTMQYHERDDEKGVVVEQYGINKCAIGLVQAHAEIVSAFIERGYDEMHKNHEVPAVCDEKEEENQMKLEVEDEKVEQLQEGDDTNDVSIAPGDGDNEEESIIIDELLHVHVLQQEGGENVDASISLEDSANEPEGDVDEDERQILSLEQEDKTLVLSSSSANGIASGLSLIGTISATCMIVFVVLIH